MSGKGAKTASSSSSSSSSSHHHVDVDELWRQLASLLAAQADDEVDHDKVEKIAYQLWTHSLSPSSTLDLDALQVLLVSHLQNSAWSKAVSVAESAVAKDATLVNNVKIAFPFAYALYRDKQHNKALTILQEKIQDSQKDLAIRHLEAQANYRAGHYAVACDIYSKYLLGGGSNFAALEEDPELAANVLAAFTAAGQLQQANAIIQKLKVLTAPASYELVFNASCASIEAEDYKQAMSSIKKAQQLCRSTLEEEGADAAEIQDELAVMMVQEAFLLQKEGEATKAEEIYNKVLAAKPSDATVISVASNNLLALKGSSENIWDSIKKSSKALNTVKNEIDEKLSLRQKLALHVNRAVTLFYGKQLEKCRELANQLAKDFPHSPLPVLTLAAILNKEKKGTQAEELIQAFSSSHPDQEFASNLALAQLALQRADFITAAGRLEKTLQAASDKELQYKPGAISTLVYLYDRAAVADSEARCVSVFSQAQKYWKGKKSGEADQFWGEITQGFVNYLMRKGKETDAAKQLEALSSTSSASSASTESLARLVIAFRADSAKVAQYASSLPSFASSVANLSADSLESSPSPELAQRKRKVRKEAEKNVNIPTSHVEPRDDEDEDDEEAEKEKKKKAQRAAQKQKKKKKASKRRLPKGYDPANPPPPPDPERWLPKWERSTFKKGKGRKSVNPLRGAQGSTNQIVMQQTQAQIGATSDSKESSAANSRATGAAAAAARKRNKRR